MAFAQPFFSIAGQKERLTNVGTVLKIAINPFSKDKIVASTGSKTTNAILEAAANNPYTTAAIATAGVTGVLKKGVTATISSLKPTTKIVGAVTATVGAGILAGSEKARVATIKTAAAFTPENLSRGGTEAGKIVEDPTLKGFVDFAKDNPILTGAIALGGVILTGKAAAPIIGGIVQREATKESAEAIREQTETLKELAQQGEANTLTPSSAVVATTPLAEGSPNNPILAASVGEEPKRKRKKVKAKPVVQRRRMPKYRKIYKEELFSYPNYGNFGATRRCIKCA